MRLRNVSLGGSPFFAWFHVDGSLDVSEAGRVNKVISRCSHGGGVTWRPGRLEN